LAASQLFSFLTLLPPHWMRLSKDGKTSSTAIQPLEMCIL
jgi:hypothetical protein